MSGEKFQRDTIEEGDLRGRYASTSKEINQTLFSFSSLTSRTYIFTIMLFPILYIQWNRGIVAKTHNSDLKTQNHIISLYYEEDEEEVTITTSTTRFFLRQDEGKGGRVTLQGLENFPEFLFKSVKSVGN